MIQKNIMTTELLTNFRDQSKTSQNHAVTRFGRFGAEHHGRFQSVLHQKGLLGRELLATVWPLREQQALRWHEWQVSRAEEGRRLRGGLEEQGGWY